MARAYKEGAMQLLPRTVRLICEVTFAGAAVPVLTSGKYPGIASIARAGVGDLTFTLEDKYSAVIGVSLTQFHTGVTNLVGCQVDTDSDPDGSTPTVHVFTLSATGTAADGTDTTKGIFVIELLRASEWKR